MKTAMRPTRGFSLIELMIAMAITIVIIGFSVGAFLAQNEALQALELTRVANASGRDALLNLEASLRRAGWGVDPRYAIDVFGLATPPSPTPSVDSASGPDELTFIARDPLYRWQAEGEGTCATFGGCFTGRAWAVTGGDTTTPDFRIVLGAGQVIEKGRLFQVMCAGGDNPVLLTSSDTYTGTGAAIDIEPAATAAFPYNDKASLQACHVAAGAGLFLVDRFHYFVQDHNGVPWLMLDTGLDLDDDGTVSPADTDDLIPVARNVEDFQVAYGLNGFGAGGPDNGADWVVANTPGTVELPTAAANVADEPTYETAENAPSRLTTDSANVRAIRISLLIRSHRTDPSQGTNWPGDTIAVSENRSAPSPQPTDRRRRVPMVSEVTLRNMQSTRSFIY